MPPEGRRYLWNGRPAPSAEENASKNAADLEWTAVSCPMDIKPGERLGQYRLGGEHMIFDEEGRSRLSMEDFAVALVDEVQQPRHVRQQVGAAY